VGWFKSEGKPAMTEQEKQLRDRAEQAVKRGLQAVSTVKEAGRSLHLLKSRELWRDTHDSWQLYVEQTFQISARRAHQLYEFSQFSDAVADFIGTSGTAVTLSERALRPLADVPPEQIQETIAEAVAESGGGEPTPAAIRKAAAKRKVKGKRRKERPAKPFTVRVAGAKVTITPTHSEPVFRGYVETLQAALNKIAQEAREAA
jgi:DNA primase